MGTTFTRLGENRTIEDEIKSACVNDSIFLQGKNLGDDGSAAIDIFLRSSGKKISSINLSCNGIKIKGISALTHTLTHQSITYLNFSSNPLLEEGVEVLSQSLLNSRNINTVHTLILSSTELRLTESRGLCSLLEQSTVLTVLDISGNYLNAAGAVAVAEALKRTSALTSLDISNNNLSPVGAKAMADMLSSNKTIVSLWMSCNCIESGFRSLMESLTQNSTLTLLALEGNRIRIEGTEMLAEMLTQNSSISHLNLSSNYLLDEGVKELCRGLEMNSSVCNLELDSNDISLQGIEWISDMLSTNSRIQCLSLRRLTCLPGAGARLISKALKANCSLTSLDISGGHLAQEGLDYLVDSLASNSTLKSLHMSMQYNLQLEALVEALESNYSLTDIDFGIKFYRPDLLSLHQRMMAYLERNKEMDNEQYLLK